MGNIERSTRAHAELKHEIVVQRNTNFNLGLSCKKKVKKHVLLPRLAQQLSCVPSTVKHSFTVQSCKRTTIFI